MFVTVVFLLFCFITPSQSQNVVYCDFEETCNDLIFDNYWIVNNVSTHVDHTYGNLSGHYVTSTHLGILKPSITFRTKDWINVPPKYAACVTQWVSSNQTDIDFTMELAQGDDLQARLQTGRVGVEGDNTKWFTFTLETPYASQFIPFMSYRNVTQSIDLDDISISLCPDSKWTPEIKVFQCDFDKTLCPEFISLSNYSYSWSIIQAQQAQNYTIQAPPADYSIGDQTGLLTTTKNFLKLINFRIHFLGHYLWLNNSDSLKSGAAGYLNTRVFNFTRDDPTFCLSFQYYRFGTAFHTSKLTVLAWDQTNGQSLMQVWPINPVNYTYFNQRWSWAYASLPIGNYSLLFRMDSGTKVNSSFAIDSLDIRSCGYQQKYFRGDSYLNFACDFDSDYDPSCGIQNDYIYLSPQTVINSSLVTPDRIRNEGLGPKYSSGISGDWFLYWARSRDTPSTLIHGQIKTRLIETNADMCIRFAYFVNSTNVEPDEQNTKLQMLTLDCTNTNLWSVELDDSRGWRIVTTSFPSTACKESVYFRIYQRRPTPLAVAIDDITIAPCSSLSEVTTAVPPTTTTPINRSSSNFINFTFLITILIYIFKLQLSSDE
ncbi:hypothetical protein I4U23_012394 [Adineta vaga]|nr:hypothetical protein I4U23_012394 [Adineta vaga]